MKQNPSQYFSKTEVNKLRATRKPQLIDITLNLELDKKKLSERVTELKSHTELLVNKIQRANIKLESIEHENKRLKAELDRNKDFNEKLRSVNRTAIIIRMLADEIAINDID